MIEVLESRPYPGRGCLATRTTTGLLCFVYFLTGRSPASRNRKLTVLDNGDIAVRETSGSDPQDPLRHYLAVARRGEWLVVGNGDHVEPLAEALAEDLAPLSAWEQHSFEPDPPIFTSRIWIARKRGLPVDCLLGHARRSQRGDGGADRLALLVESVGPGAGVVMTTYDGTPTEVRATVAPEDVDVRARTPEDLVQMVWSGLNPDLRVAVVSLVADDDNAEPLIVR